MPKYIPFLRVSTKAQETARQLADITDYAQREGWQLTEPISETISGGKKNKDRPGLQVLLKLARRGDTVIATEISRLGRDTAQVLAFIEELAERGVSVFVLNHRLATLRTDGSRDAMAQAMLTFGAEFARLERVTLRERVQSGVDYARSQGKTLGRPVGTTKSDEHLLEKYPEVIKQLKKDLPIRDVAKITDVSKNTVAKVRKALFPKKEARGE
jgi:DNA invertase Pin-like site-specific DNA recombinase